MPVNENSYVIDPENIEEMARLQHQGEQFTRAMNGVFDGIDASSFQSVLDIACGPGEWVLTAATYNPTIEFYGIDISERMIELATVQAEARGIKNAHFERRTALRAGKSGNGAVPSIYEIDWGSYDFINARLISAFMKNQDWVPLFEQCFKLLRPGGKVRITEINNFSIIGADTLLKWLLLLSDLMRKDGRSFYSSGQGTVTTKLPTLLKQGGFSNISKNAYVLGYGAEEEAHAAMTADAIRGFELLRPYFSREAPKEELDRWKRDIIQELDSPHFLADVYLLSVICQRM
jgi:SAM-dependent methyltransferase